MSPELSRVVFGSALSAGVRTHAAAYALPRPVPAPLVVLSPGFGGSRTSLTALAEELASRGYVVAAVDHTYEAPVEFPGGRIERCRICDTIPDDALVVRTRAADIRYVVDRLTGPGTGLFVDRDRIGVAGHSMGGAAAVEALRTDRRVDAAIDLDGNFWTEPPAEGIARPVLLLGAQRVAAGPEHADWQRMWERLTGWRRWLDVPGGGHYTFCDMPWIVDRFGIRDQVPPDDAAWQYGTLGGDRAAAITRAYTTAFFDLHLRGRASGLFDGPAAGFPEVAFVHGGRPGPGPVLGSVRRR
ncbi:alpha/beta hydrolase family protein [Embleya sp. NPDC059259]|uniref:alpha/beta hydrolase family protein n=1 Tax=unclassified Embleya TaxID=2699296 RepID=UPI003679B8BE